ncbi:MAG: IMP dehydrogenase [Candidatus Woesearchaeota archaeon]
MNNKIPLGLSFDDVLLVPKRGIVDSRKDIDVSTMLSRNIKLNIPLVATCMDTVTESRMAIAMAREGGIGLIHRFMTIEEQAAEILKVKRSESVVVENPYTLSPEKTVAEAKSYMRELGVSGFLIVDKNEKLKGILSRRDIVFADNAEKVEDVMTKNSDMITVDRFVSTAVAKKILHQHRIEKLPIIDKDGRIRGQITSTDIRKIDEHPNAAKDKKGKLRVGAAVGIGGDYLERAEALINAGNDFLVLDVAHAHSDSYIKTLRIIKKKFDIDVLAGTVATAKGAKDLIEAGADSLRVGIGGGSTCTTRIVAGAGMPQISAIMSCFKEAEKNSVPIISDGGLRTSGDLTKALAAGASSAISGGHFSGTEESPGMTILRNGVKYKVSRGMASFGLAQGRKEREKYRSDYEAVPEGVEALVPFRGSVREVISQLIGGLRSGISYCGARNIKEMQKNAEFVRITNAGMKESLPHDNQPI